LITSVLGDIEPSRLGSTDCHDHLLIRDGVAVQLEPDFLLDDVDAAVREAESVVASGGAAVLDCMPLGVGRDVDGLVEVARRTTLTVLAVTGFHRDAFYDEAHWVRSEDADSLAAIVVSEVTHGMGRGFYDPPGDDRSSARPAAIKLATSGEQPTALEAKLLDAVGAAAAETGLPVITHTESLAGARAQLEGLGIHGVAADRIVLSHMDRHCSLEELIEICSGGTTVCLDWMGRLDRRPDEVIVRLVAGLFEAGLGDRVVVGQDLARRGYWRAYGGGPGLAHLFSTVVPLMSRMGLGDEEIRQLMVQTPSRVLSHRIVAGRSA
jgi:phosphotriesterase-related protein